MGGVSYRSIVKQSSIRCMDQELGVGLFSNTVVIHTYIHVSRVFRLAVGPLPDVVSLACAESEHSLGLIFCSASASLPLFAEVRLEGFDSLPPSP